MWAVARRCRRCSIPRRMPRTFSTASAISCRQRRWSNTGEFDAQRTRGSICLRARELDHLAPLLCLFGDKLPKIGGRAGKERPTQIGKLSPQLGIDEARIDLLVELVDNFDGRIIGRTNAVPL